MSPMATTRSTPVHSDCAARAGAVRARMSRTKTGMRDMLDSLGSAILPHLATGSKALLGLWGDRKDGPRRRDFDGPEDPEPAREGAAIPPHAPGAGALFGDQGQRPE